MGFLPKDSTQKLRTAEPEDDIRLKTDDQPFIKDTPELIAVALASPNFTDEVKDKIRSGEYEVCMGENPDRPVVRVRGRQLTVKGSGRYPHREKFGVVAAKSAYKRTRTYREALESLIPLFPDKDAHHSFEELVENFFEAISSKERAVKCEHPGCQVKHMWVPNVDAGAVFKMIENLAGKAVEQKKIEISNSVDISEYRTFDVQIHGIPLGTALDRRQTLLAAGVIEEVDGEYRESESKELVLDEEASD